MARWIDSAGAAKRRRRPAQQAVPPKRHWRRVLCLSVVLFFASFVSSGLRVFVVAFEHMLTFLFFLRLEP